MTNPTNAQPTLGLSQLVVMEGVYPSRSGDPNDPHYSSGSDNGIIYLASLRSFAGNFAPDGSALANGQLLAINQNTALFSLLGTIYGGNGQTTFGLPDLRGRLMVGAGDQTLQGDQYGLPSVTISSGNMPVAVGGSSIPLSNDQPSLGVQYLIYVGGNTNQDEGALPGGIVVFLGNFVPVGYLPADGRTLSISDSYYQELVAAIGTTYGGDGVTTFKLPDLTGRTIVGAGYSTQFGTTIETGTVFGSDTMSVTGSNLSQVLSSPLDNYQPSLAMTFLISTEGVFPGDITQGEKIVGEVIAYAGDVDPSSLPDSLDGWLVADGRLLPIAQYTPLFQLLGTTYGGDGQSTFALPNLVGRSMTEAGQGIGLPNVQLGEEYGTPTINLLTSDLPSDAPPALTLPSAHYAYVTGESLSLIGTGISVSDADVGTGNLQLIITASDGVFNVAGTAFVGVSGNGTNTVTLTGSLAGLNSFLSSQGALKFSDSTPTPLNVTLSFQLNDFGNTGSGSQLATGTATVDVFHADATLDTGIVSGPANFTNSKSATFDFSSNQFGVTYQVKLDNGTFAAATDPVTFSGLAEGAHTIEVRALNASGGFDETPATYSWTIDATAPLTTINGPSGSINSTTADFSFTANESATFRWSLDGGPSTVGNAAHLTDLSDGEHMITVSGTDSLGNSAATFRTFTVDTTAPTAAINGGPASTTNATSASFSFTAAEAATFAWTLNGTTAGTGSAASFTGLAEGLYTLMVLATDTAGNGQWPATFRIWFVDLTAPDTTITGPSGSITSQSANFNFWATETATFQWSLDGGQFTSGSSASLTGLTRGSHTLTVIATDTAGNADPTPATRTWEILNSNPVGNDDAASITEDASPNTVIGNVLTNDTDANSDALTVTTNGMFTLAHGTLLLAVGGQFQYVLDNTNAEVNALGVNKTLKDEFIYTVDDGHGGTNTAKLTITINGANDAPTGIALSAGGVAENSAGGAVVGTLTAADVDNNDTATFTLVSGTGDTNNGLFEIVGNELRVAAGAQIDYEAGHTRSVRVRVADAAGLSVEKVLTVDINNIDEPPAITITGPSSGTLAGQVVNFSATIVDPEGAPVSTTWNFGDGTAPTVIAAGGANVTHVYLQPGNYTVSVTGTDSGGTYAAQNTVNVTILDNPPTGATAGGPYSMQAGDSLTLSASAFDLDVPYDVLSYSWDINGDGIFDDATGANPTLTWSQLQALSVIGGNYTVGLRVNDNFGGQTTASTTLYVNNAPTANADNATITEGATPNTVSGNVLTNDTDANSNALTVTNAGTFALGHGTLVLNANGAYTYTLDNANTAVNALAVGQSLTVSFTYSISDGHGGMNSASLAIKINGANDSPNAGANITLPTIQVNSGGHLITETQLLKNASDPDGDTLHATNLHIAAGQGTLVDKGNRTWTYTPVTNDDTQVSFGFQVTDGLASVGGQAKMDISLAQLTPEIGGAGDDTFTALTGNATYAGLGGTDTIVFGFKLTDAKVTYSGNQVTIDGLTSHTVLTGFEVFKFTDGTVNNADGDRLVDDLYYYSSYHDVWNAHADAGTHFHSAGWKEGRNPDAFFQTGFYLSTNPDVKAANIDPLTHFDQSGWKEGRAPSVNFDPAAYLAANPDVKAAGIDPLAHFLGAGYQEGRAPAGLTEKFAANGFDYVYYLTNNPDVAAAGVDPFLHFETIGWKEGRNPNALFDTKGYLATYGDVKAAGINPLDHYHASGWKEGRDPSVNFDSSSYLAAT